MPLDPHVKDRSRIQEEIHKTCLELDQPAYALNRLETVANWRKGAILADIAWHTVRLGCAGRAEEHLALAAAEASRLLTKKTTQAWRRDRIRTRIARAWLALEQPAKAEASSIDLVDSEQGPFVAYRAAHADPDGFDRELSSHPERIKTGGFEGKRGVLQVCLALMERDYGDPARRRRLLQGIRQATDKLPYGVRIEALFEVARIALVNEDRTMAVSLIPEIDGLRRETRWMAETDVPVVARLAGLKHRCGDTAAARSDLERAYKLFCDNRATVANIYRAGVLRALAEGWVAVENKAKALDFYRLATEAGVENPNSRPRAEDLARTCCSLARHDCRPDSKLMARLTAICEGLADPW